MGPGSSGIRVPASSAAGFLQVKAQSEPVKVKHHDLFYILKITRSCTTRQKVLYFLSLHVSASLVVRPKIRSAFMEELSTCTQRGSSNTTM